MGARGAREGAVVPLIRLDQIVSVLSAAAEHSPVSCALDAGGVGGGLRPQQHWTKANATYSEASLVRALEEAGVGRPSTYAPTIRTLLDRQYVARKGRQLVATPRGHLVSAFLSTYFERYCSPAW